MAISPSTEAGQPRKSCLTCQHFVCCQTANTLNREICQRVYLDGERKPDGQSIFQCFDKLAQFCHIYVAA